MNNSTCLRFDDAAQHSTRWSRPEHTSHRERASTSASTRAARERGSIVYVADEDAVTFNSLRGLCEVADWRAETFASTDEVIARQRRECPSCVVLDIDLPSINGLSLIRRLALAHEHVPVVFIAGKSDVSEAVEAMKAGAMDVLTKPVQRRCLARAIDASLARSRVVVDQVSELVGIQELFDKLTPREREVMRLVVKGYLNKQVAHALSISEITVKVHRGNAMRKMKADSFADLVTMSMRLSEASPLHRKATLSSVAHVDMD